MKSAEAELQSLCVINQVEINTKTKSPVEDDYLGVTQVVLMSGKVNTKIMRTGVDLALMSIGLVESVEIQHG